MFARWRTCKRVACVAGACPARNYVITFEHSGFYSHVQTFLGALVISKIKAGTSLKPLVVPESLTAHFVL